MDDDTTDAESYFTRALDRLSAERSQPPSEPTDPDGDEIDGDGRQQSGANLALDEENLREALSQRVLHQPRVTATVARIVSTRRGVARLRPERPFEVLLAAGPTGTGKTTLAYALAEIVYGDRDALVRLDCSELSGSGSVNSIVGPPPGYVGSDSPQGWLTSRVAEMGGGVVLFDEIEKAHPSVWPLLLQIAEGRLTDSGGRTVGFSETTIILTSNVGADAMRASSIGFTDTRPDRSTVINDSARSTFPSELLSRTDAILVFDELSHHATLDIARVAWGEHLDRLGRDGWELEIDDRVLEAALGSVDLTSKGARELERTLEFDVLAGLNPLRPGHYRAEITDRGIRWTAACTAEA